MGSTHREAVLILYLIGGALGVLAMFVTQADVIESYVIFAGVLVAGILGILRLERPQLIPTKSPPPVEVSGDAKPS